LKWEILWVQGARFFASLISTEHATETCLRRMML
jgi:hypothetical protein